jgi:hypothetical protein
LLQHLLWVRCHTLDEAIQAADILVRDANLSLVMLDLRGVDVRALRRVFPTTWYRLQRALERTDMAMAVFTTENRETKKSGNLPENLGNRETGKSGNQRTMDGIESYKSDAGDGHQAPAGLVGSARLRLTLASPFQLDTFAAEQAGLAFRLPVGVQRRQLHKPDRCSRESESRGSRAANGSCPDADRALSGAASSDSALVPRHSSLDRIFPDEERRTA